VNVETKAVEAVDAHTFTKQAEKLKQTLSARKLIDGNCFLGQERSADDGIHATRGHNVTSVS
jgi:curli biogenesis system outer membrane secretion channel CsgG